MPDSDFGELIASIRRLIIEVEETAFDMATTVPAKQIAGLLNAVARLTKTTDRIDPDI